MQEELLALHPKESREFYRVSVGLAGVLRLGGEHGRALGHLRGAQSVPGLTKEELAELALEVARCIARCGSVKATIEAFEEVCRHERRGREEAELSLVALYLEEGRVIEWR